MPPPLSSDVALLQVGTPLRRLTDMNLDVKKIFVLVPPNSEQWPYVISYKEEVGEEIMLLNDENEEQWYPNALNRNYRYLLHRYADGNFRWGFHVQPRMPPTVQDNAEYKTTERDIIYTLKQYDIGWFKVIEGRNSEGQKERITIPKSGFPLDKPFYYTSKKRNTYGKPV
jgi:hypothetical protein